METFVTIYTFNHPAELAVLRSRLEAEGIECLVLNELTTQIRPTLTPLTGGAQLQVKESDVPHALEILKEVGTIQENDLSAKNSFSIVEAITSKVSFLQNLSPELRISIALITIALLMTGIVYWAITPSSLERLSQENWCVDKVVYKGKSFATKTNVDLRLFGEGFCEESLELRENGKAILPGFTSAYTNAVWKLDQGIVQISQADTFGFVYNGNYELDFSENKLILRSEQTVIYCHSTNYHL